MARRLGLIGGLLTVALLFGVQSAPSHAAASFDGALLALVNQDRAAIGLPALQQSPALAGVARERVGAIARSGTFDNVLSPGVGAENAGWESGYGADQGVAAAQHINQQYLGSGEHRRNILSSRWTSVGVGSIWVASWDGHAGVWIDTEEFGGAVQSPPAPTVPGTGGSG